MEKSDIINELATALAKAQGEFTPARMDATNPFLKNNYADLGSVIAAAKAACAKYGLAVSQPASTTGDNVTVTTVLMHASGQWMSSEMTLPLGKESGRSIAQAAGSIITYLRRYSLSAMLGIYADEDTDGNGHSEPKPAKKADITHEEVSATHDPQPAPSAEVSLETARAMTTSKNEAYGDMTPETLSAVATGIRKAMTKPDITPECMDELKFKLDCAFTVLRANEHPAN